MKETHSTLRQTIEEAWSSPELRSTYETKSAVEETIRLLDKGQIRVAEKVDEEWKIHGWIKQAILLYFPQQKMETLHCPPFEYHDKIPLKKDFASKGIRVVPNAVIRFGSFLESGTICMPSYINIGAYIGEGTLVDTWATVGSCAQIGKHVHLSGGVGIGGVLEPIQGAPVIVEDHAFIGSRCILVEGVRIGSEAVIGANVTLTSSTKIIDVTQPEEVVYKGYVPPRSVVIPGSYTREYPSGKYQVNCALIIGKRKESTDKKTALNDALRVLDHHE